MTLYGIVTAIERKALEMPNIRSSAEGSVVDYLNNTPSIQYGVFFVQQTNHTEDTNNWYYGFNLYVIDRLTDTMRDNALEIQSSCMDSLHNILLWLEDDMDMQVDSVTYYPFTQRFADECAGMYASVRISISKEWICPDDYNL